MGVSWVLNIPFEEGKNAQHTVDAMNQRLTAIGAKPSGHHQVDCDVYNSQMQNAPVVSCNMMHNREYPVTTFAILENGTCVSADNLLDLLLLKLKPLYNSNKNTKIECKGTRYEYVDFVIKIGTVTLMQNNSVLGVILEVEYLPCNIASNCSSLMKEFIQGLLGRTVDTPNHVKNQLDSVFTPSDGMHQYLELFNTFKKSQSGASQPSYSQASVMNMASMS